MFFNPLKASLKIIVSVIVVERDEVITEDALTLHWLFCKVVGEPMATTSSPATLSHSNWIVPPVRSYITKQELREASEGANSIPPAERLVAFWLSEKTNTNVCKVPELPLGETETAVGTGAPTVVTV